MHNSWEFLFKKSSKYFVALVPEKTFAMVHRDHAFHCTEFVKINHRTLLYEKNSLINRHVTSLLQNGIITILSIKKYSIQRKKISFYVMSTNNFSLIIRVHLHPH